MQKVYNFTTNTIKTYINAQASSLSAFVISKTRISGQKPRGRWLNANMCGSHFPSFFIAPFFSSTHLDFSTKRMLITVHSFPTTQRLHSFKFTLVNKATYNTEAAVRCLGHHFLTLYACAHEVSFLDQSPRSSVWKRDLYTSEIAAIFEFGLPCYQA